MQKVKVENPIYIRVSDQAIVETLDINDKGQVMIDLDCEGNVVGVELLVDGLMSAGGVMAATQG